MMIIDSNANGRLIRDHDVHGSYYYMVDNLGFEWGAWSREEDARACFEAGEGETNYPVPDIEIDEHCRRLVDERDPGA